MRAINTKKCEIEKMISLKNCFEDKDFINFNQLPLLQWMPNLSLWGNDCSYHYHISYTSGTWKKNKKLCWNEYQKYEHYSEKTKKQTGNKHTNIFIISLSQTLVLILDRSKRITSKIFLQNRWKNEYIFVANKNFI